MKVLFQIPNLDTMDYLYSISLYHIAITNVLYNEYTPFTSFTICVIIS